MMKIREMIDKIIDEGNNEKMYKLNDMLNEYRNSMSSCFEKI